MRGARHVWNAAISLTLGAMIGILGHQFVADAVGRLWPAQAMVAGLVRALLWAIGLGATCALFSS